MTPTPADSLPQPAVLRLRFPFSLQLNSRASFDCLTSPGIRGRVTSALHIQRVVWDGILYSRRKPGAPRPLPRERELTLHPLTALFTLSFPVEQRIAATARGSLIHPGQPGAPSNLTCSGFSQHCYAFVQRRAVVFDV